MYTSLMNKNVERRALVGCNHLAHCKHDAVVDAHGGAPPLALPGPPRAEGVDAGRVLGRILRLHGSGLHVTACTTWKARVRLLLEG